MYESIRVRIKASYWRWSEFDNESNL